MNRKQKRDDFFFDDCLICHATKKADDEGRSLSGGELMDVFEKQKKAQEKKQKNTMPPKKNPKNRITKKSFPNS